MRLLICLYLLACLCSAARAAADDQTGKERFKAIVAPFTYQCKFAKNGWSSQDWMLVKSARWDYFGKWVQLADCIRNATPAGASQEEMVEDAALSTQTYTSMLLTRKVGGNVDISSTMSFDYRMAPLIVIADDLGKSKVGIPEYRKHTEVVLYDEGLNVWQHFYNDGTPSYIKLAWAKLKFVPKHNYDLKVSVRGKQMTVTVDGHELGCTNVDLPDNFFVGITGCEGINRFYDFKVEATVSQLTPADDVIHP